MFDINKFNFKVINDEKDFATFELSPLPKGYGYTVSNIMRRVLLSSISGSGVVWVKVSGAYHEYTSLKGVSDDVLKIIMNLKNVVFDSDSDKVEVLKLEVKGPKLVKASDIELSSRVKIVNKDFVLTELFDAKSKLSIEMGVEKSVGYRLSDEDKRREVGLIPLDTNFSPVLTVNIKVEKARVGQNVDLDKVTMEVKTNGAITPMEAVKSASEIIKGFATHLYEVANGKVVEETASLASLASTKKKAIDLNVDKLNVSTRLYNCLVKASITSLNQLSGKTKKEIFNLRGLGDKSKKELLQLLTKYN
ncbi:MAG: DNA-directed RNA polymerase subunit alpha, partial [bacterium]